MYSEFRDFEDLKAFVLEDKESTGMDVSTRNRYPIRFVLFDNFRDCSLFVDFIQSEMQAVVYSVDKWIDPEYPDLMITHTELADRIKQHVKQMGCSDCVIAPFSELARFYDNNEKKTFDALLKTIKAIEASADAANAHQRVYIPIVGLEGKMETFAKDSQSTIWRLRTDSHDLNYRLIITNNSTFGVQGLEQHYTVVHNVQQWLNVWKDANKQVTPNIICTSRSIFANACFAQPDNAFMFVPCEDAYEFLTKGLQLQFGGLQKEISDGNNWDTLAERIDLTGGFSFSKYVRKELSFSDLDYKYFIKLWFEFPEHYYRWLLTRYWQLLMKGEGYICRILSKTTSLTGFDFIEQMALDMTEISMEMEERSFCLKEAVKNHVVMREAVQTTVAKRLEAIAAKYNATSALKYFTGISDKEKELAIAWIGKGAIDASQVKYFYPDLYYYLSEPLGVAGKVPTWVAAYMKEYKTAKIANVYTPAVKQQILTLNQSEVTFDAWYQSFSTTRTLLQGRGDIEVFYWIDGLGVEWIPLIKEIIREKNSQNIYLNDIKIARTILPTRTSDNKADLQKLLPEGRTLEKAGDLDKLAHDSSNCWPTTIIKEVDLVRSIIEDILMRYNGKKVAIVSDHGLTYLSQLCDGLGLAGVTPDHHGRIATKEKGGWTTDENYMRLEDGKTVCALKHTSLCNKVPKGQGIHGGCTPEEVLVPVFIISSSVIDAEWDAAILTTELNGANPTVQFRITNAPTVEIPVVEYNDNRYALHHVSGDIYQSDPLVVDENSNDIFLVIGSVMRQYKVSVSTGATEDDLFGGF